MNETKKTITFACIGGLMLALAGLTFVITKPTATEGFEGLNQPFFENFTDSTAAKSLEVYALDPDSATRKRFVVKQEDGIWRIPSHHGYPAEAADRLATTASSLIGVEREALKGKHKSEHERFGVLDPNDPENADPESTGKRITLKDDTDEVLVDLIIGDRVEDEVQPNQIVVGQNVTTDRYYVRHPDENQTYVVTLDLDLSTKFSDWIRPDLLQVENSDIERLKIDNYELQPIGPMQMSKKQGDQLLLTRESGAGGWELDGLNAETEQMDAAKVSAAVATIDELKIVGVRPKMDYQGQPLLTADLQINEIPELMKDPRQFNGLIQRLQGQLADYGFNLIPTNVQNKLQLVSSFGEVAVGTGDGVSYVMQFGKPVDGDENAIEIGNPDSEAAKDAAKDAAEAEGSAKADDDNAGSEKPEGADEDPADAGAVVDGAEKAAADESAEEIKSRYLMIRVSFDESLLGEKPAKPVEPVAPVKPEGYAPAEPEAAATDDAAPAPEAEGAGEEKEEGESQEAETPDTPERDPKFVEYDKLQKEYDNSKIQYELELAKFGDDAKAFAEKVDAGQKRIKELNERFGRWFYVISAENLKSLQMNRSQLVSAKEAPKAPKAPAGIPGLPGGLEGIPGLNMPDRPNLDFNVDGEEPAAPDATDKKPAEAAGPKTDSDAGPPKNIPADDLGNAAEAGAEKTATEKPDTGAGKDGVQGTPEKPATDKPATDKPVEEPVEPAEKPDDKKEGGSDS